MVLETERPVDGIQQRIDRLQVEIEEAELREKADDD